MIKFNNSDIIDWNFDDNNIIKVYHNNAVCYYKLDVSSPSGQTPCFAVVADISQYSDTEFEDVFNQADGKWYKLNNLNQYEEYGVYGSGRTSCEGSTSRLPQGYTEVEYIENTSQAYLNLGVVLYDGNGTTWSISTRFASEPQAPSFDTFAYLLSTENTASPYYGFTMRWQNGYNFNIGGNPDNLVYNLVDNGDGTSGATITCPNATTNNNTPLTMFVGTDGNFGQDYWRNGTGKFYTLQLTKNNALVRNLVPAKRGSDNKYGMYDLVTDTFYLSPNNVDFNGGDPVTPTDCVTTYEGKLTIDDGYEYQYSGGSWVNLGEVSGSTATLPDVPFVLNYNAKNYDSTTYTIPMTTGQLNDTDAVAVRSSESIVDHSQDGYITISSSSMRIRKQGQDISLFNRQSNSTDSDLTIITKALTRNECNIITNRDSNYNWMYRQYSDILTFHGNMETGNIICSSSNPDILSVRTYYDNGTKVKYNNWTQNTSTTPIDFSYGSTNSDNSNAGALFVGYAWNDGSEQWQGDFYWVYMSQEVLTDEQIQQVIDYNEEESTAVYPKYYDVMLDPPDNVSFSSMTEAEEYECPWVGMIAIIDGVKYIFSGDSQSGYEWVVKPSRLPVGYTEVEYVENQNMACINTGFKPNQDTRFVAEMQTVSTTSYVNHFGAGGWNEPNAIILDYENGYNGTLHLTWGTATGWTVVSSVIGDFNKHTYDWNKNEVYRDNTLVKTFTYGNYQAVSNLHIFTTINNGSSTPSSAQEYYMKGKLYSLKIYDNGTLVRDMIPCTRDSDSKAGVYDIVNDVFYSSAKSGYELIAGPTVN